MGKPRPFCRRGMVSFRSSPNQIKKTVHDLEKKLKTKLEAEKCAECGGFHIRVVTCGN